MARRIRYIKLENEDGVLMSRQPVHTNLGDAFVFLNTTHGTGSISIADAGKAYFFEGSSARLLKIKARAILKNFGAELEEAGNVLR